MFLFLWYYIIRMKIGEMSMERKKMSLARFYIPLLIILSLSILILSLSYSKESGNTDFAATVVKEKGLKIVYASGTNLKNPVINMTNYMEATENAFSITNERNDDNFYELDIVCDDCFNKDYYYSIDGKEPVLITNRVLLEEDFSMYGSKNDHVSHSLRVFSPTKAVNIEYRIKVIDRKTIEYAINKDNSVVIEDNNYIFDDSSISNYVLINDDLYRIIKIKNDVVSCKAVDEDNEFRKISFSKKIEVLKGNGFLESPYEVDYES